MNVSSGSNAGFSEYPEFRVILKNISSLKRMVSRFNENPKKVVPADIMDRVDDIESAVRTHFEELNSYEQLIAMTSSTKLTQKQRIILRWLLDSYDKQTVYTVLIKKLSEDLAIPSSTIRWNLRGLRDADLIRAGDKDNKGIPVSLTPMGRIMANYSVEYGD